MAYLGYVAQGRRRDEKPLKLFFNDVNIKKDHFFNDNNDYFTLSTPLCDKLVYILVIQTHFSFSNFKKHEEKRLYSLTTEAYRESVQFRIKKNKRKKGNLFITNENGRQNPSHGTRYNDFSSFLVESCNSIYQGFRPLDEPSINFQFLH